MPGKTKQKPIHLECSECKNRNYRFFRSSDSVGKARLEVSKYCKFCQKHTVHIEAK